MRTKDMRGDIDHILLTQDAIQKRVKEMGEQISRDYADAKEDVVLVCILKGAVVFFADLARQMTTPLLMDFMAISSYGNERKTSGIVRINKDIDTSITGRHLIIADDIMDSGLTLNHMRELMSSRNPASMKICCLLDKRDRRECDIVPDYCGFTIPNEFVVGYGLDYCGFYRNLPFIGVLKPSVYKD